MTLVLVIAVLLSITACDAIHPIKELIKPQTDCQTSTCDELVILFEAFQQNFKLNLVRNKELFADTFFEQVDTNARSFPFAGRSSDEINCYYLSKDPNEDASFSLCNGRVEGNFAKNNQSYTVSYSGEDGETYIAIDDKHEGEPVVMDSPNAEKLTEQFLAQHSSFRQIEPEPLRQQEVPPHKYLELLIITDRNLFVNDFSSSRQQLNAFVRQHVNSLNVGFRRLGFTIVLIGHLSWESSDEVRERTAIDRHLMALAEFGAILSERFNYDLLQLLSGNRFSDSPRIAGISFLGLLCRVSPATVSIMAFRAAVSGSRDRSLAVISAHEMGHQVGLLDYKFLQSDNASSDTASCIGRCRDHPQQNFCTMRWRLDGAAQIFWSECSKDEVRRREQLGLYRCTYNRPVRSLQAICGNGLKEGEEQCDCEQTDQNCQRCCDMTTCRYTAGSTCAGRCCTNCNTLSPAGTACRPSTRVCDVADTCDGTNDTCNDRLDSDRKDCGASILWCIRGNCEFACPLDCGNVLSDGVRGTCVKVNTTRGWRCDCESGFSGDACSDISGPSTLLIVLVVILLAACVLICAYCVHKNTRQTEKKTFFVPAAGSQTDASLGSPTPRVPSDLTEQIDSSNNQSD